MKRDLDPGAETQHPNPIVQKIMPWLQPPRSKKLKQLLIITGVGTLVLSIACYLVYSLSERHSQDSEIRGNSKNFKDDGEMLKNVAMGLKIMPSHNSAENLIVMDWSNHTQKEELSHALTASHNHYAKSYHFYNHTHNYFPTLRLFPDSVPVGNSKKMCLHVKSVAKEDEKQT